MSKPLGSEMFGTHVVRADEYVLMAGVMRENGSTLEETALTIEALDDLLQIQRMSMIGMNFRRTQSGRLRKNSHMLDVIDQRMDQLVNDLKAAQ